MTIYNVYAKTTYNKRFQRLTGIVTTLEDGTMVHGTSSAKRADIIANNMANKSVYKNVKIIITDDNGIKNEIIYK